MSTHALPTLCHTQTPNTICRHWADTFFQLQHTIMNLIYYMQTQHDKSEPIAATVYLTRETTVKLIAVCHCVSTPVITVWQRSTTCGSCGQWQPPSSGATWLTKWPSNTTRERQRETPDSSTMRTTSTYENLISSVYLPSHMAFPDWLIMIDWLSMSKV